MGKKPQSKMLTFEIRPQTGPHPAQNIIGTNTRNIVSEGFAGKWIFQLLGGHAMMMMMTRDENCEGGSGGQPKLLGWSTSTQERCFEVCCMCAGG